MQTENFQMYKLDLEKAEEPEIKLPTSRDHRKSKRIPEKNIYFCFINYVKAFDCIDNNNCGKFLKRWEYQTTLPASWEAWMKVKKQKLKPDMEQQTGSKLGKECIKAVYRHPVTSVQCAAASAAGRDRKWSTHSLGKRN